MPRWSIPILWYPDSAITSLYQPVLTLVPLANSASKAWSLLANAYPQQDSAIAKPPASLPLGINTQASLTTYLQCQPTGARLQLFTSFVYLLLHFIRVHFIPLRSPLAIVGMEKNWFSVHQQMTLRTPPSHRTMVNPIQRSTTTSKKTVASKNCKQEDNTNSRQTVCISEPRSYGRSHHTFIF